MTHRLLVAHAPSRARQEDKASVLRSYTILMVKANTEQQTAAAESQSAAENISGAAAAGSPG